MRNLTEEEFIEMGKLGSLCICGHPFVEHNRFINFMFVGCQHDQCHCDMFIPDQSTTTTIFFNNKRSIVLFGNVNPHTVCDVSDMIMIMVVVKNDEGNITNCYNPNDVP